MDGDFMEVLLGDTKGWDFDIYQFARSYVRYPYEVNEALSEIDRLEMEAVGLQINEYETRIGLAASGTDWSSQEARKKLLNGPGWN